MPVNIEGRLYPKPAPSGLAGRLVRFGRRRDRGAMAMLCAVMVPVLVGFGTLAINQGNYAWRAQLLRQTTQAAALAAANKLSTYYSSGSTSTVVSTAQTFAASNMSSDQYGTVVPSGNVVVGTWDPSTNKFTSGGPTGNAVPLFFGAWFGKPSLDVTSTAVASYASSGNAAGNGAQGTGAAGRAYNTIVINDMSDSFSGEISDQVAADLAILNCVRGQTGTTSQFGITFINGHAYTYQALEQANANNQALQTKINAIVQCTAAEDPNCGTGSNVAAGLYSAIQQFSSSTFTGKSKNIVIITDGAPNASPGVDYSTADGVSCGTHCTDQDLLTAAQSLAATAAASGISISTIYYSGDDTNPSDQASYRAFLASLVTGSGTALVAPTAAQIDSAYSGVCSTIPASVKASS
jgi:Flp pilus assembly protein TadG